MIAFVLAYIATTAAPWIAVGVLGTLVVQRLAAYDRCRRRPRLVLPSARSMLRRPPAHGQRQPLRIVREGERR